MFSALVPRFTAGITTPSDSPKMIEDRTLWLTNSDSAQWWAVVAVAAVDPETNELLHPTLVPVIAQKFVAKRREKHVISNAVVLLDGTKARQNAGRCHGLGSGMNVMEIGTASNIYFII